MKKIVVIAMLTIAVLAFAQVDFVNRKVTATGYGAVNPDHKTAAQRRFGALKAAELDAVRRIIEEIKGVPIDGQTTVRDLMLESDIVTAETEGLAQFFEIVGEPRYGDDGSVEIDVELSLYDMDWRNKVVQSVGVGSGRNRPMAIRAAEMDAKRQLLARVSGMYLTSATLMRDGEVELDVINATVQGVLRNARMVPGSEKYFDDGSIEVTCEVKLGEDLQTVRGFSSVLMQNAKFNEDYPLVPEATYKLSQLVATPQDVYTGLIIDCTGIDLRPAFAPKIFSVSGKEIYGTASVSESFATQQGMFGYEKMIERAKQNMRVDKNPLVIKATGVRGVNKADIIISDADAARISQAIKSNDFLAECRVIAVVK